MEARQLLRSSGKGGTQRTCPTLKYVEELVMLSNHQRMLLLTFYTIVHRFPFPLRCLPPSCTGNLLLVHDLAAVGFVHEHEPIASLAFLHPDYCIVRVFERNLGKKGC